MNDTTEHLLQDELVASALGSGSPAALAHLQVCDICRAEMESYQTILRGIHTVFNAPEPRVHVFRCKNGLMNESHSCTIRHPVTNDQLTINCHDGWLNGRISHSDQADLDGSASSVRLFSRQGLVSSVPVEEDGSFLVRCLNADERHSMTIVLPGDGSAIQLLSHPDETDPVSP